MDRTIRAWMESQKPDLVDWAEEFLTEHLLHERGIDGSQLRNLLNIAQSGSPIKVTINFLRYQMARESAWKDLKSGQELARLLGELQGRCGAVTERLDRETALQVEAQMTAQLLGFLIREFKYRETVEKPAKRKTS